jgi:1-acyl-sn-glycerol-3-phosphate acyltransferase
MVYGLKLLLIALLTLPLGLVVLFLGIFDFKGKLAYEISRLWSWAILKIGGIRLRVQGLDRLDSGRQYIFMANHQSNIDIPVLIQSLRKFQLRWIAKKELLFFPLFGWALWASRHIIVDRANRLKAMVSLRKAKEKIKGGISVVVFPEGTRSPSGELLPFKRGGFILAIMTKTPIVPITINGSRAILPKGDWRIRGGEIEVIVSRPIELDGYHRENLQTLLNQVRLAMQSRQQPCPATHDPTAARIQARIEGWVQR